MVHLFGWLVISIFVLLLVQMVLGAIYSYKGLKFYFALQTLTSKSRVSEETTEEDLTLITDTSKDASTVLVLSVIQLALMSNIFVGLVVGLVAYLKTKDFALVDARDYLTTRKEKLSKIKTVLFILIGVTLMFLVILFFASFALSLSEGLNDL